MCRAEGPARGFTLLEGVVALAILGALAVASLGAVGANLRATERAGRVLTATALAEDRLAAIRLLRSEDRDPLPDSLRDGEFSGELSDYTWTARTQRAATDPTLLATTVTVRWDGGSETFETLLPGVER